MKARHAMILAINSALLAVLFVLLAWLYRAMRSDVERRVASELERAAAMSRSLARLREDELSSLAQSVAVSPLLRGALATGDRETVEDVLATLAAKNGLDAVFVARGGAVRFADRGGPREAEERAAGLFRGRTALGDGNELWLGERPRPERLAAWSGITGARYAVLSSSPPVHDLGPEEAGLLAKAPDSESPRVLSAGAAKVYARRASLLDGRFELALFSPHAPYWTAFEERRDSLLVLGGALFFAGLLLSVFFARLIERYALAGGASRDREFRRLAAEVDAARRALLGRPP